MKLQRIAMLAVLTWAGSGWAQQTPQPADSGLTIRTESRLVVVDAVVMDKKNQYVRDLKAKDFKVWEDNKEQTIKSFSFEADPTSPLFGQNHYMVLFFDNSTMNPGDQIRARQAAVKFIDANAGPDRLMAVVNFSGALHVMQNFTASVDRLKAAAQGVQISSVSPNDTTGPLGRVAANFASHDMLASLREMAKNLSSVPGRKTLVLLTSGFPLRQEQMSELTVAIDACNRANVAVYPIDVRGLSTQGLGMPRAAARARSVFQPVAYNPTTGATIAAQTKGGGGAASPPAGGGGGRGGASSPSPAPAPAPSPSPGRGGTPTTGTTNPTGGRNGGQTSPTNGFPNGGRGGATMPPPVAGVPNIYNQSRELIPKIPDSVATNQQLLYALADGTGGFVIQGDNDLLAGLQRIASEQNEYYVLGYTPPVEEKDGSCHVLKVKVDRGGVNVRFRTGYCTSRPHEVLAGSAIEKQLETRAGSAQSGTVGATMTLPFFYTSPNVARVTVAMDITPDALKFEKQKNGKLHSEINVLGVAYKKDNSVAARFSDIVKLDADDKEQAEALKKKPYHYENQFEIASGSYTFKMAFSEGGENFGKVEMPLAIDAYQANEFALSGIALSREARKTSELGSSLDASLIEDRTPLIAGGFQFVPAGSNQFKTTDKPIFYFEIYEPMMVAPDEKNPPGIAMQMRILDKKSKEQKFTTGLMKVELPSATGNPVIPEGLKLPITGLPPGAYTLELTALDVADKQFKRTTEFEIQ